MDALLDTVRVLSVSKVSHISIDVADVATRDLVAKYKAFALSIESGMHCPSKSAKSIRSTKFPKLHGKFLFVCTPPAQSSRNNRFFLPT